MKLLGTLYLLLTVVFLSNAQLELADTMHFGRGLTMPNPATDRALIVTPRFLFAADQDAPGGREGAVYVYTNNAGVWKFSQKLTDQIGWNLGWFGFGIEYGTNSYGEWLAVNSTWSIATNVTTHPVGGPGTGDLQMFKLNPTNQRWEFFQYIVPSASDEFGNSPAISGDWLVCGALGHSYNSDTNYAYSGAAFFYQFDGTSWVLRQGPVLSASATNYWNFAYATEIEGTNAFFYGKYNNSQYGAIYLYELRNGTWVETGVLRPNSPKAAETFGVAYIQCRAYGDAGIKHDLLTVGAPMRGSTVNTGGVYFFQHNGSTWQQIGSYFPANLQSKTYFANSGDMRDNVCVIGCRFADWTQSFCCPSTTDGKGSAYVFKFDGSAWNLDQILAPDTRQHGDWFASWPATDGTNVYIVTPGAYVNGAKTNILQKFVPAPTTLAITSIKRGPQGLVLKWATLSNLVYTIEISTDVATPNWAPVEGVTWPISSNQVLLPNPSGDWASFRVRAE
jgi:hypothetical protein